MRGAGASGVVRRLALALAVLVALAGCGIPTDGDPRPLADETPSSSTADTAPDDAEAAADVYLVRGANALAVVSRGLAGSSSPETVMEALLAQPSEEELADGLSTSIPLDTVAHSATQDGGLVTVDLSGEWDTLVQPGALLAYAQVVLTLTDLPGVEEVRFLVDGEAVAAPTINQGDLDVVNAAHYENLDPKPDE